MKAHTYVYGTVVSVLQRAVRAGAIWGQALCLVFWFPSNIRSAPAGAEDAAQPMNAAAAGSGELLWKSPAGLVPLPVLDLSVELEVSGIMVHGAVTQSFANTTSEEIEALYVFPLPERAAVHHMEIRIGERRIVSTIQERSEARRTYGAAKEAGRKTALVEQERPNLFTTSLANINPGEKVDVRLEYVQELAYDSGRFGISFPLTYTPRFAPGPEMSIGVPLIQDEAAGTDAPPARGNARETTSLPDAPFASPHAPSVPSATVAVRIRAGFPLQDVLSGSHTIRTTWKGDTLVVEPRAGKVVADRDFTLEWKLQPGTAPRSALFTEDRVDGRYGLLMVVPPLEDSGAAIGLPTETLFIVDVSGSMAGPSIEQAREALLAALRRLRPEDMFNIMAFDDKQRLFKSAFVRAQGDDLDEALRWAAGLQPEGGTLIFPALRLGLNLMKQESPGSVRRIVFLTDGAVENEEQIFTSVVGELGEVRLHTLGIGPAPNRYLMRKMAACGRGLCAFVSDTSTAANQIDAFFARLDRPVMTDLTLVWDSGPPTELYPSRLPDLHAGEPLFVSMRFPQGQASTDVVLEGRLPEGKMRTTIHAGGDGTSNESGVSVRWARTKVESLLDSLNEGADAAAVRVSVIEVSKAFNIVTKYTSLVAVEEFPTASAEACLVKMPNAQPGGSQGPVDLPRSGTLTPLFLRVAVVLMVVGLLLMGLARKSA